MKVLALFVLLVSSVEAAEPIHVVHARKFMRAFSRKDAGTMAIIAAQSPRKITYALVVFSLLETREYEAARKLASLRSGAPEGKGLARLCEAYIDGVRAGEQERNRLTLGEKSVRSRQPAAALVALGKHRGTEGTVTGARVEWARARALIQENKVELSIPVLARCATIARAIGWIQRSAAAEGMRLQISLDQPSMAKVAYEAATNLIADARALDDPSAELNARVSRAKLHLRAGRNEDARNDYSVAIQRARVLDNRDLEGKLLGSLASVFHVVEKQPRRAIRFYKEALDVFLAANSTGSVVQARINLSRALTDVSDYAGAEDQLNLVLQAPAEGAPSTAPALIRIARVQLAYVYRRQGRLDAGRAIFEQILSVAQSDAEKDALHLELGEVQLKRGDFYRARAHFQAARERQTWRALAGEAHAWGGLDNEDRCRALFRDAATASKTDELRGKIELQWAMFERSFGQIDRAIELAESARGRLATETSNDYGNAATSWVVLGDLYLLDSRRSSALSALEKASVFFFKLKDPGRAIPAYSREILVLLQGGTEADMDSARQRLGFIQNMGESVKSKSLRSMAECASAMVSASIGDTEGALERIDTATTLGQEAGDWQREATARSVRALLRGGEGLADAMRSIAMADERIDWSPLVQPRVVGERPDDAASIALRCLMETENPDFHRALELVERVKAKRLLLALRGRDSVLARRLSEPEFRSYVDARSAVRESRITPGLGEGASTAVAESTGRLSEVIKTLAPKAPIAFPVGVTHEQIRGALRDGELLCLFVDDPFARAFIAIDASTSIVRTFDPAKPWEAIDELKKGATRVIVSADGFLALAPRDGIELTYVASAASLVNQRSRTVRSDRVQLQRPSQPVRIDLQHPQATEAWTASDGAAKLVLLDGVVVTAGAHASIDGYVAAAAARIQGGADWVLISLSGKTDPRIIAKFRKHFEEEKFDVMTALRRTRKWAARQDGLDLSTLVLWGAP